MKLVLIADFKHHVERANRIFVDADGTTHDAMKDPKTDIDKCSLPGRITVRRSGNEMEYIVLPDGSGWSDHDMFGAEEGLETVWDSGPVSREFPDYDSIRSFVNLGWAGSRVVCDPRSEQLMGKIVAFRNQSK